MRTPDAGEPAVDPIRAALSDITSWSESLPIWQRDALRRIYTACDLSSTDLDELYVLCRQAHRLVDETELAIKPNMLGPSEMPSMVVSDASVTLRSVAHPKNVNALAEDQTLNFSESGLTIVYGDNGAGKSGYSRILKRACRARDQEEILPNAYRDRPSGEAAALVRYSVGGVAQTDVHWRDGAAAPDDLSEISVFDWKCALVHVDGTNDLAYTPIPLRLVESLANVCLKIAYRLKEARATLAAQVPVFQRQPLSRPDTAVTRFLETLSASTPLSAAQFLGTLTEAEQEVLDHLKRDLSIDPAKQIQKVTAAKQRVVSLLSLVKQAERILSPETTAELKQLITSVQEKTAAAKLAASKAFGNEPLPQVGSEVWKSLWETARQFSGETYSGQPFPNVSESALCVLCQQRLSPDAARRLTRFEDFVRGKIQQVAEQAKRKTNEFTQGLGRSVITKEVLKEAIRLLRDDLERTELCTEVVFCLIRARVRLRTLLKLTSCERTLSHPQSNSSSQLQELLGKADRRLAELQKSLDPKQRQAQEKRLRELEDRAWLATIMDAVRDEVARLKRLAAFDAAIQDTDTTRITRKATDVSRILVTNRMRDAFASEVLSLGIGDRRIELVQEHSGYGVSRFRVSLIRKPAAKVAHVLSEGEHRCVALAAFLAELATAQNRSGVIFDDPVSSLDHLFRDAVVRRLVKEAALGRQVIVFTHDIAFLMALDDEARTGGLKPYYESINRSEEGAGICAEGSPAKTQPVPELLNKIEQRINSAQAAYTSGQAEKWADEVKLLTGRLRDAWELALEKVVAPVLRRHSNKIHPSGLRKLIVLTNADYEEFKMGYDFCCIHCHTDSPSINRPAATPEQLLNETSRLREWLRSVRKRQETPG
jgi:energy-coupling factor transporter ATP-binding protein EcfA2